MKFRLTVILLFAALICGFSVEAQAQPTSTVAEAGSAKPPQDQIFGVGLYASLTDGIGPTFRHHLANTGFSYQLTIGPWKTGNSLLLSVGVDAQYDLLMNASGRLYAAAGYGYYYSGNGKNDLKDPQRFGAGVGYEIPLSSSIALSGSLLVTSFQPSGSLIPLPSLGMFIYFK